MVDSWFISGRIFNERARWPYSSVLSVSYLDIIVHFSEFNYEHTVSLAGESVIIIDVIVFPHRESCKILVNFESLETNFQQL